MNREQEILDLIAIAAKLARKGQTHKALRMSSLALELAGQATAPTGIGEIAERVESLSKRVDALPEIVQAIVDDQGVRLDALEAWRTGATTSIGNLETYIDKVCVRVDDLEINTEARAAGEAQEPAEPTPEPLKVGDKLWVAKEDLDHVPFFATGQEGHISTVDYKRLPHGTHLVHTTGGSWWISPETLRDPDLTIGPVFTRTDPNPQEPAEDGPEQIPKAELCPGSGSPAHGVKCGRTGCGAYWDVAYRDIDKSEALTMQDHRPLTT